MDKESVAVAVYDQKTALKTSGWKMLTQNSWIKQSDRSCCISRKRTVVQRAYKSSTHAGL